MAAVQHSFVPPHIFDEAWREGNFVVPKEKGVRIELLSTLTQSSHYGVMYRSGHEGTHAELQARIAALTAYDETLARLKSN